LSEQPYSKLPLTAAILKHQDATLKPGLTGDTHMQQL